MGNQFFNSIVRGAGYTIGRNLVNNVGKKPKSSRNIQKINSKLVKSIELNKEGIIRYNQIILETQESFKNGKLTENEAEVLIHQCKKNIAECESYLSQFDNEKEGQPEKIVVKRILNWKGKLLSFLTWLGIGMLIGQLTKNTDMSTMFNFVLGVWVFLGWMIPVSIFNSFNSFSKPNPSLQ